jgi:hypothetical protein
MKKVVLMVCICLIALPLCSCKSSNPAWAEKVDSIDAGMTYDELIEIMGEPDAHIGMGPETLMYILPDQHVTVICIRRDYTREDYPLTVSVKPTVLTYDEFKEKFQYYPDDPDAWWN